MEDNKKMEMNQDNQNKQETPAQVSETPVKKENFVVGAIKKHPKAAKVVAIVGGTAAAVGAAVLAYNEGKKDGVLSAANKFNPQAVIDGICERFTCDSDDSDDEEVIEESEVEDSDEEVVE